MYGHINVLKRILLLCQLYCNFTLDLSRAHYPARCIDLIMSYINDLKAVAAVALAAECTSTIPGLPIAVVNDLYLLRHTICIAGNFRMVQNFAVFADRSAAARIRTANFSSASYGLLVGVVSPV